MRAATTVAVAALSLLVLTAPARAAGQPERETGPIVRDETPVTANHLPAARAQNSPALEADPTDSRFVVLASRVDAPKFGCALHVSGDGGRSWRPANLPKLPAGADRCYAPEVAFDTRGVIYYLFAGLAGAGNEPMGIFLATSSDRARSFSPPRRVLGPFNFMARMEIDPSHRPHGRLHLVWLAARGDPGLGSLPPPPNPILGAHSDDGGRTFSRPVHVANPGRRLAVAPVLALGRDRAVHVAYYDLNDDVRDYHGLEGPTWEGRWSLVLATSRDAGASFVEAGVVDEVVPPERVMLIFTMPPPALAADAAGRLFVAWHDARNGDWDVFLSTSSDGGRSWTGARRLNDDDLHSGRHQYLPRLGVAPAGRLDAIFYDRRFDPANIRNDVFYTFSTDGAASFASNLRVTSEASDSRRGERYVGPAARGLVDFGGRIGLLSAEDVVVAAWTDTRNALASPYQDVFSARVAFRSGSHRASRPPPAEPRAFDVRAAAIVVVAVVALFALIARRRGRTSPVVASSGTTLPPS